MELRCSKCGQVPPKSEWENTLAPYGMHLRHIREFCKKTKVLKVKQLTVGLKIPLVKLNRTSHINVPLLRFKNQNRTRLKSGAPKRSLKEETMSWGDTLFDRRAHTFCATIPRKENVMFNAVDALRELHNQMQRNELMVRAQMLQDRGLSLSEEALAEICALKTFDELIEKIDHANSKGCFECPL